MAADVAPEAVTVRGTLPVDTEVGFVLPLERIVYNLVGRHRPPETVNLQGLRDAPITLGRLAELRQHPLSSLVNLR